MNKRKDLHLKVALSIESIFKDKIHELYGTLSHHFSSGGDKEKAEEYMFKAGKEAEKASASYEAIKYFKKALDLYISNYGDRIDTKKIGEIEEKIAISYLNKGFFEEAVEFFDKSQFHKGAKYRKYGIFSNIKLFLNIINIIINLYLLPVRKLKTPIIEEVQIANMKLRMGVALGNTDVRRCFFDSIDYGKKSFKYDIQQSQTHFNIVVGVGGLFTATGISYKIGEKILNYAVNCASKKDSNVSLNYYGWLIKLHSLLTGSWDGNPNYKIINKALEVGDFTAATGQLLLSGYMSIEQGCFEAVDKIIATLKTISEDYNFNHARLDYFDLKSKMSLKKRKLHESSKFIKEGIKLFDYIGDDVRKQQFLGILSRVYFLQGNYTDAENTIKEAKEIINKLDKYAIPPIWIGDLLVSDFSLNLKRMEDSLILNDLNNTNYYDKLVFDLGKNTVRLSKNKLTTDRTEILRLMGRLFWINNKPKKAYKMYNRSIYEGQKLGANIELSRTYYEIGTRLLESEKVNKSSNRLSASYYLKSAEKLFNKYDLIWDLDQIRNL